jgi:PTH1 family peptidyl-tRNA hydrolase
MLEKKMVVGLGNPGVRYVNTRHNLGFKVIESLAENLGFGKEKEKFGALINQGRYADVKVMLVRPWQFMNNSGRAVAAIMDFYKLDIDQLMVVSDDLALDVGRIRIRSKGTAGGHNGLADIIDKLGTSVFARCRIGIGNCPAALSVDYVLDRPDEQEKLLLNEAIIKARNAVISWIEHGLDKTMNEFNKSVITEDNDE